MGQAGGNHTHELSLTSRSGHAPAVQPSLRAVWWAGRSGAPTSLLDFGNWRFWQGRVLLSMAYSQPASCQLQRRIKWMFFSLCWRWCLFCLPIAGIQKCEGGRLGVVWSRGPSRVGREHLVWASWTKKRDKGHAWASWAGPGGLGIPWPLSEVRIKMAQVWYRNSRWSRQEGTIPTVKSLTTCSVPREGLPVSPAEGL